MQKKEIKELLNKRYNREDWKLFTKKIFGNVEYFQNPKKIETNNDKILEFVQIGNLKLKDKKNISLFELKLIKNLNIYKNKVELRNIVSKFIDQFSNHGVLVVFDNQGSDYRLTFSSKYSEFNDEGNIIEKETSSKRYTYLLGENESCTTAAERFYLLYNSRNNLNVSDMLNAFNVDKITDDFFNTYKTLYLKLYDEIEKLIKKDKNITLTFKKNKISTEEFAKKFLGQLVFLYFLQKKGWLGIKKNKDKIFEKWGSGDKNFVRNLFEKKYCNYKNFFNDVLEPLFIAFSTDLPENYYSKLDTKVPFLNGGLFDPIKNYNWLDTQIVISNNLMKDILDNFEMYNFTIQEEDPQEKEIAIDPEMLGKVFENLLSIKDRKSKGTFYTPRKIAKYICEESLINFLKNFFKNDLDCIENIVRSKINNKTNNFIKKNHHILDEKIKNIKICDPAVGSGEFPVELMNICINVRMRMNEFFHDNKRTPYLLKRNFIKNSIYGVDIENSAVETTKLRLWLSLILDEENYDKILPLPNLDYKIFCGDSLLTFDTNLLAINIKKEITDLKNKYFQITNIQEKIKLKKIIDGKFKSIVGDKVSFDFKIFFEEVFYKNDGFDLVIGNPPYVQIQKLKDKVYKKRLSEQFKVFHGNSDLYCLFFEKGSELLNSNGSLAFITSNKWLKTDYGELLRNYFLAECEILNVIDFKSLQIFKSASVDTSIVIFKKGEFKYLNACEINNLNEYNNLEETIKTKIVQSKKTFLQGPWVINNKRSLELLYKLKNIKSKILLKREKFKYGIKTGLNKAFIIDEKIKNEILSKDIKSKEIIKPVIQGFNMKKFTFNKDPKNWIIFTRRNVDITKYKGVEKYLFKYYDLLKPKKKNTDKIGRKPGTYKWYEIADNIAYYKSFEYPKVAWMGMNRGWKFSYIPAGYYIEASLSFLADEDLAKYLVGVYSSKVHKWYFKQVGTMFDDGGYMCKVVTVAEFPVVKPTNKQKNKVENFVDTFSKIHNERDKEAYENFIMELYGLNQNEKDIIKNET